MFEALKNYADFSGRARRKEFWLFVVLIFILQFATTFGDLALGTYNKDYEIGLLTGLLSLFMFIPSLSVQVRRLHDTDRSGWWILIIFIPILGALVLLIFSCLNGTEGENRFGDDPKEYWE